MTEPVVHPAVERAIAARLEPIGEGLSRIARDTVEALHDMQRAIHLLNEATAAHLDAAVALSARVRRLEAMIPFAPPAPSSLDLDSRLPAEAPPAGSSALMALVSCPMGAGDDLRLDVSESDHVDSS